MLLWIILTVMTSAAAVWVSIPLLRRFDDRRAAASNDLEVYRDQLAEVQREMSDGLIDADQATNANTEIKRRMLSAERLLSATKSTLTLGERHFAVVSVAGLVVLGSVILYSNTGRPDLPSVARAPTSLVLGGGNQGATFQPTQGSAQRGGGGAVAPTQSQTRDAAVGPPASGPAVDGATQGAAAPALGTVDDMILRLVDRLKKDPNNAETLRMLGWSYFSTEKYAEAADAYAKAIALQPKNAALHTSHGEALVRVANGEVKADAIAAFDQALALDPKDPRARFFKGLVLEQTGKKPEALAAWIAVLADAGPDDAWAGDLKARILELASELGVDVSAKLPVEAPVASVAAPAKALTAGGLLQTLKDGGASAPTATTPTAPRGPTADDVKAAERLSATDRTAMIRGMVDGLATRLEKSPRDTDGWIQLIRSRKVLGEDAVAKTTLVKALGIFSDAPQEQSRIAAAAAEIGIKP
jgi:cytochrome c-type biogenesis protein CcmH